MQIAQAQGKTITGQYIFQLANQIIQNPNGVLAQAILKIVNQHDGGKSSHTTTIIKNVIKISSGGGGDNGDNGKPHPKYPPGQHYDLKTGKCIDDSLPQDPCDKDPNAEECTPPEEAEEEEVEEEEEEQDVEEEVADEEETESESESEPEEYSSSESED